MQTMPDAFHALTHWRQFLLWKAVFRDNEWTKLPCDARGNVCDAHDPQRWMTSDEALAAAQSTGLYVAFVLTANDPFFFIDIDDALIDDQWSPFALELCAMFPGAAVEVSQSMAALHIIGTGTAPLSRRTKYKPGNGDQVDLYTEKRFIALTGFSAQGDAGLDFTPQLVGLVDKYLQPDNSLEVDPANWTTEPDVGWSGPDDDQELLAQAFKREAGAAFGGQGERFNLYYGIDKPDDDSSADMSLAGWLANITGHNCERVERLMWQSGRVREKWERHKTYLRNTILKACATLPRTDPAPAPTKSNDDFSDADPTTKPTTQRLTAIKHEGKQVVFSHDLPGYFEGCVYLEDREKMLTAEGRILSPRSFDIVYGGKTFMRDGSGEKSTESAFTACTAGPVFQCATASGLGFRPDLAPGTVYYDENETLVNIYFPPAIASTPGDITPFTQHLENLFPDEQDREIIVSYMAAMLQYKGHKFKWAPLIQGAPGNGKTLFTNCLRYAIGIRYVSLPQSQDLATKFNQAFLTNKIMVGIEDIKVAEHQADVIEALKPMISNREQGVQGKGSDQVIANVCANFMINSNYKDAIRKAKDDRRFAMFFTPQQTADDIVTCGMGGSYFADLYGWLESGGYAHVTHYLENYVIRAELNPAVTAGGLCNRAPITTSTSEAIKIGYGTIEQNVLEWVAEEQVGFKGGFISGYHLNNKIEQRRWRMSPRALNDMLTELGYIRHPALNDGRTTRNIPCDNQTKPRLYVKADSLVAQIDDSKTVMTRYIESQGVAGSFAAFDNANNSG